MIAVALKGLAGRKLRALLTALAVVIGVSMVSGTFLLTDTMQKTFDGLFDSTYEQTDAVIGGKEIVKNSTSGSGVTIPAAVLEKVRALPQVIAADWVAGEIDVMLLVVARDVAELQRVLVRLSTRGAQRLTTLLRLEELKPASPLPVAAT